MIFGITGRKRSGKDTVADHLIGHHGFTKYQIASPLKQAVHALYGWDMDKLETDDKEIHDDTYGISPRQAMQFMGAEFNKYMSQHFPQYAEVTNTKLYMMRMLEYIKLHPDQDIAIPDVRMPFTAKAIRDIGGVMVRVERGTNPTGDQHDTERFVDTMDVDVVIRNDGTLEDLFAATESALQGLRDKEKEREC
ncbi:higher eukaryotic phosphomevalonate kinase [Kipferlia bialata]|uniref:Higher eukaryotic phosphomevalonate kinase n=1 Tax=Kipferlia bialata TaxID=797122 RepID=A0A9K3D482_9EUKA|nr:higher eukaryotic phosphomevalonate kinase [Kipferlia bialata]|eukprot:g9699.t1